MTRSNQVAPGKHRSMMQRVLILLGIFAFVFVLPGAYRDMVMLLVCLAFAVAAPLYEMRAANPSRLRAAAVLLLGSGFAFGRLSSLLRESRPTSDVLDIFAFVFLCAAGIVALVKYVRFPEKSASETGTPSR